jgi:hypothetical protein
LEGGDQNPRDEEKIPHRTIPISNERVAGGFLPQPKKD